MPKTFINENDFIGNEKVRTYLSTIIKSGHISHAYIFSGEEGLGKCMMALHFAMMLLCEGNIKPCGNCRHCKQILANNHPDVLYVDAKERASLGVDEIRESILETLRIRPFQSAYKIYIINDAHKMTLQAQNALLKSIEEPPAYAIFLLVTSMPGMLVDTIKSRCVKLKFSPLPLDTLQRWLSEQIEEEDGLREAISAFSLGCPGIAMTLSNSDAFKERFLRNITFLKNVRSCDRKTMVAFINEIGTKRADSLEFLACIQLWYRDILLIKVTKQEEGSIFKREQEAIFKLAREYTLVGLGHILESIEKTSDRIRTNVNIGLSLEILLTELRT